LLISPGRLFHNGYDGGGADTVKTVKTVEALNCLARGGFAALKGIAD